MTDLFLILHKVRGSPAFDIASRCEEMGTDSDPSPWWIIPTSGHRAYPYRQWELFKQWELQDLVDSSDNDYIIPSIWPDHYAPSTLREKITVKAKASANALLTSLGLAGAPIKRRKIG